MTEFFDLSETQVAWLAGLFEGEGTFLKPSPSSPRQPRVSIHMTDQDVVEKVAGLLGVKYIHIRNLKPDKWKQTYRLDIKGKRAMALMKVIYPWMCQRRRTRIDEIFALFEQVPIRSSHKLTGAQAQSILLVKGTQTAREVAQDQHLHIKTIEKIWHGSRWTQLQPESFSPANP